MPNDADSNDVEHPNDADNNGVEHGGSIEPAEFTDDMRRLGQQYGLIARCCVMNTSTISFQENEPPEIRNSARIAAIGGIAILYAAWRPEAESFWSSALIGVALTGFMAFTVEFALFGFAIRISEKSILRLYGMIVLALCGVLLSDVLASFDLFKIGGTLDKLTCKRPECETYLTLYSVIISFIITSSILLVCDAIVRKKYKDYKLKDYVNGIATNFAIHIVLYAAYFAPEIIGNDIYSRIEVIG